MNHKLGRDDQEGGGSAMQRRDEVATTFPDLQLYSIPSRSSWFQWDEIHEIEMRDLEEFFNNSSLSRTPKVYKQYRDFIINKFREDPSRRLTFTHLRKCLIGDVSSLSRVFLFLDHWGLINFGLPPPPVSDGSPAAAGGDVVVVRVEEGLPTGIRVVEFPNSTKVLSGGSAAPAADSNGNSGFRMPPLASYSDVFENLPQRLACRVCGEQCYSEYYKSEKDDFIVCVRCFKNENYVENQSAADFKLKSFSDGTVSHKAPAWTDAETMLLLDAVVKHGDDWSLVLQQVENRTKLDCISRLLQLPFGENMLVSPDSKVHDRDDKCVENSLSEPQTTIKSVDQNCEDNGDSRLSADEDANGQPPKRRRVTPFSDFDLSLIKQAACLSTVVGPNVAAAAAEASIKTLCDENHYARKVFDFMEDDVLDMHSMVLSNEPQRVMSSVDPSANKMQEDSEEEEPGVEEISASSILKLRAAVATALGAAAANAKLLADQEEREIEHLLASMFEAQMSKIQYKMKFLEELESIMEKEYEQIQHVKESVLRERVDVLRKAIDLGISRWKDNSFTKSFLSDSVF